MKAVVYTKYGPPEVLKFTELEMPVPQDDEILVKVRATTVTAGDWRMRKADPPMSRIFNGLLRPTRINILGFEIAGDVEAVGKDVANFKVGDAVFAPLGFRFGGYVEYKCLKASGVVLHKPDNISYEEAAAIPIGGSTALHYLQLGEVQPGERVLIYGASGSVGTFAVQIAKAMGAQVTGVCSGANLELIRSIGADEAIDYTVEKIWQRAERYDVVFDTVGKLPERHAKKMLAEGGRFVSVDKGLASSTTEMLEQIIEMVRAGKLNVVIDKVFPFEEIVAAHHYVQQFRKKGNVAMTVA